MEKMHQLLKEEEHDCLVYLCYAHWMSVLGSKITPPETMKHVMEVQNIFVTTIFHLSR